MQYIEFNPAYESIFAQNGFRTFEDIIDWNEGHTINRNEKRDVNILKLTSQDGLRVFFMKRFFSPHLKDMLFTFRNFGRLCSQAELEWRNSRILLENGIETYRPACWGAQTCCGIERRSFFITEKINGRSLIEFLLENWSGFASHQREKLIIGMARFFRKLHNARLSLPDSYLWHLFVLEPIDLEQSTRFAIIDLHRMRINAAAWHHAARNLGALLFSLPEEWFDTKLRELFLNTYLEPVEGKTITNQKAFLDALKKREKILIARRKKPSIERLKKMA